MSDSQSTRRVNTRIEGASRAEIEALQLSRMQQVVNVAYETNPFYRSLYDKAKVRPEQIQSLADFRERIPYIDKAMLLADQQAHPPYGLRGTARKSDVFAVFHTSGTSGAGQETHCLSELNTEFWSTTFFYQCHWSGIAPGDRVVFFQRLAMEMAGNWFKSACDRYGLTQFPLAPYDTPMRMKLMQGISPHLIMTQPSYLARLSIVCQDSGIDPKSAFPDLKAILFAGETHSGVSWVRRMEEFWGVRLGEWYGSTQAGGSHMFSCEHGLHFPDDRPGMLHNVEHRIFFEALDIETGLPARPGEPGEIFLTNLYNEDFPIIRFRTYDRGRYQPAAYCSCGRPFDGIELGSISRVDDMIKMRGQNVWPEAVSSAIFDYPEVDEFQARVWIDDKGRERVEVRVELRQGPLSNAQREQLLKTIREKIKIKTDLTMDLIEAEHGTLPRFEQKARRWTDDRIKSREQAANTLVQKQ